jgi:hypothetical protein
VVFLPRFLKHNTLENHKVVTGAMSELASLPDTPLLTSLLGVVVEYRRAHYKPLIHILEGRTGCATGTVSDTVSNSPSVNNIDTVSDMIPDTVDGAIRSRSRSRSRKDDTSSSLRSEDGEAARKLKEEMQQVMGGLRPLGYELDGAAGRANGSIAKAILGRGVPPGELLQAAEGFSWICRRWVLDGTWQGAPTLRPLYSAKLNQTEGRTPLWTEAMIEHNDRHKRDRMTPAFGGLLTQVLGGAA